MTHLRIEYKNYKDVESTRNIVPINVFYGATGWHPAPQWFLKAWDIDKGEIRDFAMKDIISISA